MHQQNTNTSSMSSMSSTSSTSMKSTMPGKKRLKSAFQARSNNRLIQPVKSTKAMQQPGITNHVPSLQVHLPNLQRTSLQGTTLSNADPQQADQCAQPPPNIYQALWSALHVSSFYVDQYQNHNTKAQQAFITHVTSLKDFLPCSDCADHMNAFLAAKPMPTPGLYSADEFVFARWVVDLHNDVNMRQGKMQIPFDSVHAHYVNDASPPQCPAQQAQAAKELAHEPTPKASRFNRLHVHHILGVFGIALLFVIIIVGVRVATSFAK